ncbi:exopolyphosphatase [Solemya velum gill symbiont]|uniref:exopolyphosphatase n=1 Tax=Solemya velum gill symbiont TaxID=2340 RepID=UPI000998A938|nr:exopolyphosphatase [Solemya velum gill symbiont]OOZ44454.1 exopolyphosphatase [Solemya velum gill symbiont]OOZ46253.1 exopolyphosphatase [Solemya velum gill symbiont]OOZ48831.1 exopolyphosphatase [Solemya velum gill symbiont]OOZ51335.1 exopolyphosphatase [Solemya velum gill symbiont]OOZ53888.1 exopolyphosphatase [Solemya velum gill symbiont]
MQQDKPDVVAAIDLGSNSFHMIVARLDETGTLKVLDRLREPVRLGGGLTKKGKIDKKTRKRALDCLERFGQRISDLPRGSVRVVGTNTLRVAKNSRAFVQKAEHMLGHEIEIISGQEEARIIFLGVAHGRATRNGKRLVVDIGGGSTELIVGEGAISEIRESLHIGCVSASRDYFEDGKITEKRMEKAEMAARLTIYPHAHEFHKSDWQEAVGCSGTIKAIRNIAQAEGWCDSGLTLDALYEMRAAIIKQGDIRSLNLAEMKEDRKPVLPGGLAVLIAVFEALNISHMRVSDLALREGLLYDLVGRINREDVRDATVDSALQRWSIDKSHAEAVAATALQLYSQVADKWKLNTERENMLRWAALLHEIGLQVAHSSFQKHGAYILANADLPGFSRPEQELLATLVLNHRKKFRFDTFLDLVETAQTAGSRLCVILRLAALLHRGRPSESGPDVGIEVDGMEIKLSFPEGWLDDHPLTNVDLKREKGYLKQADYRLVYQKT